MRQTDPNGNPFPSEAFVFGNKVWEHIDRDGISMRGVFMIWLFLGLVTAPIHAQHWPQWRGSTANGVSESATAPTHWSDTEHILWQTELAGSGTSSPVVWGDRVFVTAQIGGGPIDERGAQFRGTRPAARLRSENASVTLVVQAIDLSDGQPLWYYRFMAEGHLPTVHRNHNFATPSVATDGTHVVAWFGTGQLVVLDLNGTLRWSKHLGDEYGPFEVLWGHASSPVLHDDLIVLLCDHPAHAYILALDAKTGEERWMIDRGTGLRSYSTPLVITYQGRDELIVNSSDRIDSYALQTGAALWHIGFPTQLGLPMPVFSDGILYSSRGYTSGPYLAVRPGGTGDVSETHMLWRHPTRAPYISSLLVLEGLVYMATENGILTVTDTSSGDIVWQERLGNMFAASPVSANGHIYLLSEDGETVVITAEREPRIVARNQLPYRTLASPAIVDGMILIRSDHHLFCIGD